MAVFLLKVHFLGGKSAIKFLYVKTVNNKVVRQAFTSLSDRAQMIGGGRILCD